MADYTRGPKRTTKQHWLNAGLDILVHDGYDRIKISTLSKNLDCSRSSFYWYFENLSDLLNQILGHWQHVNTNPIIKYAGLKSATITQAVLNIFICWADETKFNARLDFAVREWSRHSGQVRQLIRLSDNARIEALRAMFIRHGYEPVESLIRARTLYHSQIGYYAVDTRETFRERTQWVAEYVLCFTGIKAANDELDAYRTSMREIYGL